MQVILMDDVKDFLLSLEKRTVLRVHKQRDLLAKYGHLLRMPFSRCILPGIFELRVIGQENIRLIYTFRFDSALIFHIFTKKTEKISVRDMNVIKSKFRNLQI